MKMYKVMKTKREALGLTQAEVAEMAGVSSSAVSNYEIGREVSIPVATCIKAVIDNQFENLYKTDYFEAMILARALQLSEATETEKLINLGYITTYASKLQLELLKNLNRAE